MTRRKTPPRQATEPGLAKAALARPHIRIESPVTSLSEDSLVSPASGPGCFPRPSSYSDSVLVLLEHLLSRYTAREISAAQVLYGLQDAVPERRGRRRAELKKRQTGSYGRVCALIVRLLGSFAEGMVKCGGARVEDQTEGKTVQVGTTQAVEEQAARKQEDICVGCAAADVWLDAVQAYLLRAFSGNSEEHSLESQTMESGGPGSPAHRRKKRRRKEGGLERAPRPNVFVVHPPASGDNREGGASPPHETRGGETNDIARQMETLLHAIKQHLHSTREVVEEAAATAQARIDIPGYTGPHLTCTALHLGCLQSPVYYQTRSVFIRLVDRVGTSVLSSILSSLSCRMFFTDAYALSIPPAFRRVVRSSVEVLLQILGTCPSNKSEASTLRAMGSAALHNVLLQPLAGSSLASVLSPLIPALHSLMFDLAFDIEGDDVAFVSFRSNPALDVSPSRPWVQITIWLFILY
ncbi:hypothetical protein CSUI_009817 [Cystoisospora suis]|uniref:Uncharacterized protein n=1 Tax=Cystoisospora suis TaxID=483139 RepID=A0A2C6KI95_9APIC|nr:hypothetical protein CSUI_009817 [Cystoisospora suis]